MRRAVAAAAAGVGLVVGGLVGIEPAAGANAPTLTISDVVVTEGNAGTSNATFSVRLSRADNVATVEYATADGTALSGLDYQTTTGILTFNKKETTKTITVPIIGDVVDEPAETFSVVLSNASRGVVINDTTGVGTIDDDDEAVPPPAAADLALTMTDSPDPVGVQGELTYDLHVVNHGPDAATEVTITDHLKPYHEFVSASAGCNLANATVTCTAPAPVAAGAAYDAQITVRVNTTGAISNTAEVSSATADPNSSNNSDTEATTVDATADLAATLTHAPEPADLGQAVVFTVSAANAGPSPAQGTTASVQLPAALNFTSASAGCSYDAPSRAVTCSAGTLAAGASAPFEITVEPTAPGQQTVTAVVSSATAEAAPGDNTATDVLNVTAPRADVAVDVSSTPGSVLVGDALTLRFDLSNAGPQTATGVKLQAQLPEGVEWLSFGQFDGISVCNYDTATRVLDCTFKDLASGATAFVEGQVRYTTAGTKTTTATVSSNVGDPVPANNAHSHTTTVLL
jgi:uncharacterized repeat protein (TIGR01451 family)